MASLELILHHPQWHRKHVSFSDKWVVAPRTVCADVAKEVQSAEISRILHVIHIVGQWQRVIFEFATSHTDDGEDEGKTRDLRMVVVHDNDDKLAS